MRAWQYVLFMCGQVGLMCLARFFFQWNLAYADQSGATADDHLLDPALFGLLILGFRLFDGVTDPIAGVLSDRWVSRGRERRYILLFAFLIPILGLALIFLPHHGMAPPLRWSLVTVGLLVFFIGYTLYGIPYWSLVADYAGEDHQVRRRLSNLLGLGMLIATAVIAVGSPSVVAKPGGFLAAALWFGIPGTILMALPFFAQPARPPRPHQAPDHREPSIVEMFSIALKHRRFLAVLVLFSGSQMSFTVMTAGAPFIAEQVLGGSVDDVPRLMGPFLLAAFPFFVLVPTISRRVGWERAVVAASLALGVVYTGTGLLGGDGARPFLVAGLLFAAAGPMAAVLLGIEGEAVTTCARESKGELTGIYFSVLNLVVKAMNGVATLIGGLLIKEKAYFLIGPAAGALLWVGVAGYFALRPRRQPAPPA
ncbi:MAG: MFS transporter [Planctomycetota bacterium]|nr:MFS transporter [Planctomycetota bacterium]